MFLYDPLRVKVYQVSQGSQEFWTLSQISQVFLKSQLEDSPISILFQEASNWEVWERFTIVINSLVVCPLHLAEITRIIVKFTGFKGRLEECN